MAGHGVEATGEATHWYSCPRPVLKREAVPALPANAVEGWLSQTPLDLETPASHSACMHPLETREPSHSLCLMGVYPTKTAGLHGPDGRACRSTPLQLQRMWSERDALQSEADDCSLRCEFYHLMRLDKQTCDWHNNKCNSLYVTQDISKEVCQAAGNAVALIRV